jgi:hypothetical protein
MGVTRFTGGLGVGKPNKTDNTGGQYNCAIPVIADLGSPIALDIDSLIDGATSTELPNATTKTYTTANIGTSPCDGVNATWILATPRNVTCIATHSTSIVATTILVTGKDVYGMTMSELLTITATGTSKSVSGNKAFKSITSIAITSAGNSTTNTIEVGHGDILGLPYVMASDNTILKELKGGVAATAGTTVLAATTSPATTITGDVRGTYLPNSACDASQYKIIYIPTSLSNRGVTQA